MEQSVYPSCQDLGRTEVAHLQPGSKTASPDGRPSDLNQFQTVVRIRMDDASEFDCKAGDVPLLPSGHDAWVVGDEPGVVVDFQEMIDYAKWV